MKQLNLAWLSSPIHVHVDRAKKLTEEIRVSQYECVLQKHQPDIGLLALFFNSQNRSNIVRPIYLDVPIAIDTY